MNGNRNQSKSAWDNEGACIKRKEQCLVEFKDTEGSASRGTMTGSRQGARLTDSRVAASLPPDLPCRSLLVPLSVDLFSDHVSREAAPLLPRQSTFSRQVDGRRACWSSFQTPERGDSSPGVWPKPLLLNCCCSHSPSRSPARRASDAAVGGGEGRGHSEIWVLRPLQAGVSGGQRIRVVPEAPRAPPVYQTGLCGHTHE